MDKDDLLLLMGEVKESRVVLESIHSLSITAIKTILRQFLMLLPRESMAFFEAQSL